MESATATSPLEQTIATRIREAIPDAQVQIRLFAGSDHFQVRVVSSAFAGKSRLARHRMVYTALGEALPAGIHALALTTQTPEECSEEQA